MAAKGGFTVTKFLVTAAAVVIGIYIYNNFFSKSTTA